MTLLVREVKRIFMAARSPCLLVGACHGFFLQFGSCQVCVRKPGNNF